MKTWRLEGRYRPYLSPSEVGSRKKELYDDNEGGSLRVFPRAEIEEVLAAVCLKDSGQYLLDIISKNTTELNTIGKPPFPK